MAEPKKSCALIVGIQPGKNYVPVNAGMRLHEKFSVAVTNYFSNSDSYTYIQLRNEKDRTSSYFFDKTSKAAINRNIVISSLLGMFTVYFLPAIIILPACVMIPLAGALDKARIRRTANAAPKITMAVPISAKTHYEITRRLQKTRHRCGVYSLLFNNCSHYAAGLGKRHGMPLKRHLLMTPLGLARQIRRYAPRNPA
ncbi:MAG: hypothetical protein H6865_06655 [Rhodospirillales bacterium]|nr:hypothetical protein [Alphaproteobacteria bacterium]MCB9987301.1 hypothetical protein [Rhodospirillales bacterium]USO07843.1 MAG: hypothetical protein H6866_01045 [Rhodospirillales bacterium]